MTNLPTKFEISSFSCYWDIVWVLILKWGMWPWPHLFQGWFAVGRLELIMHARFEALAASVTKIRTVMQNLENGGFGVVRGDSRSSAMSPFDRVHTTSYSAFIETLSILHHFWDIASYLSKVADFHLRPNLHWAPPLGVTHSNFVRCFEP